MPIFDQGYRHWDGKLSGLGWRWLAITRFGVAAQWKSRWVRIALVAALGPAGALVAFLIFWGLLERQVAWLQPLLELLRGLPEEIRVGAKAYRGAFWTMAFHYFFGIEMFFSMLLVLLVGPNLISQDLRYNAIPLYFSRPLTRLDYFLGKLGVIGFYVALVSIGPALLAYMLGVAFGLDKNVLRDTGHLLVASLVYGAVVVASAGTLMLAISSVSRNSRMVGAIWIGLWIVGGIVSQSLTESVKQDWCPIVSYQLDLLRLREALLDTAGAREKIRNLFQAGQDQLQQGMLPRVPPDRPGRRRFGPGGGPMPIPIPMGAVFRGPPPPPGYDEHGNSTFPWQWSAGVLLGLWMLSIWTLSSRVKSLDRLK